MSVVASILPQWHQSWYERTTRFVSSVTLQLHCLVIGLWRSKRSPGFGEIFSSCIVHLFSVRIFIFWSVKIDLLYCLGYPQVPNIIQFMATWQHKTALPTLKKSVINKIVSKPHFIINKREGRVLALWCHYKARQTLVVLVFWSHFSLKLIFEVQIVKV